MDARQELAELRRLEELERRAAGAVAPSAAPVEAVNPAEGMGALERGLVGAGGAARKAYLGVRSLVPGLGLDSNERDELALYNKYKGNLGTAGTVGEIAADTAMMAIPGGAAMRGVQGASQAARAVPVLGKALAATRGGLGAGVASSAALSAAVAPEDREGAAIGGAVGGALGDVAGRVLTKTLGGVVSKGVTPDARALMDQGVDVPMWKASENKILRNVAERARVLPMAGDVIKGQERGAIESWNKKLLKEASPPIPVKNEADGVIRWERKPTNKTGTEGLRELDQQFDEAYGALYANRGIPVDDQFRNELSQTLADTQKYLPGVAEEVGGIARRVNDTLAGLTEPTTIRSGGKAVGSGKVSSRMKTPITTEVELGREVTPYGNVKKALNELDDSITAAWRKGDAEKAQALSAMRESIHNLRNRGLPPEVASEAKEINSAYAKYKDLQRASGMLGAQKAGGVITPAQQLNAIKARDRTPDKSNFALGQARGQQDALLAQRVLGNELPDVGPGTAEKLLPFIGFGAPMMGMDLGATALLGTQTGQNLLMGKYPVQGAFRKYGNDYLIPALRAYGAAAGN